MCLDLAMHGKSWQTVAGSQRAWAARGPPTKGCCADGSNDELSGADRPRAPGANSSANRSSTALSRIRKARLSKFDTLATFTAFTARSLAFNYRLHLPAPPDVVVLAGGGAANSTLRAYIQAELQQLKPSTQVQTSEDFGWPLQSVEPAAFALLAWLRVQGKPGNLPETTGSEPASAAGTKSLRLSLARQSVVALFLRS